MTDHSMLMRAAAEKDIHHVRLGEAVAYIEANMEPEKAAEAVSLIHAAISPAHAVMRHEGRHLIAADPAPEEAQVELTGDEQSGDEGHEQPAENDGEAKPKKRAPRKAK